MSTNFGPTAILTPANLVTLGRMAGAPFVGYLLYNNGPSWLVVILWFVVSASDGVDGFVARKMGATTSGAFLDPLADKVAVLIAMTGLVFARRVAVIALLLIALREISMSIFRSYAARRGVSVPARLSAKIKTVFQDLSIGFACLPWSKSHEMWLDVTVWIAVGLTLFTGFQYLIDGRKVMASIHES